MVESIKDTQLISATVGLEHTEAAGGTPIGLQLGTDGNWEVLVSTPNEQNPETPELVPTDELMQSMDTGAHMDRVAKVLADEHTKGRISLDYNEQMALQKLQKTQKPTNLHSLAFFMTLGAESLKGHAGNIPMKPALERDIAKIANTLKLANNAVSAQKLAPKPQNKPKLAQPKPNGIKVVRTNDHQSAGIDQRNFGTSHENATDPHNKIRNAGNGYAAHREDLNILKIMAVQYADIKPTSVTLLVEENEGPKSKRNLNPESHISTITVPLEEPAPKATEKKEDTNSAASNNTPKSGYKIRAQQLKADFECKPGPGMFNGGM